MNTHFLDSFKDMGIIQLVLSFVLCVYGFSYLFKYVFARYYRLSATEQVDKLLMALANFSLSTVNILLLFLFKV
ncbi:hypothetical protein [Mucilaginibacter jinjuensis]|uniref:Uncharacterized protein n=1 Tax=Mucilaginibacter jinjuensis TaxID=1176721 RepID=A0ABY7T357_9SPHI|nr:hypothetical protein [Mucilaginibacter jinjuensis]WCT10238.1 hypothetical protein PQO05_15995 [Mucilaginibacter jinjuensis]